MTNHTPGPWDAHDNGHIYGDNYASAVARVFENTHQRDGEAQANARLIAAAPDILAALERSLNWLASYPGGCCENTYQQARAAICKAKGEA